MTHIAARQDRPSSIITALRSLVSGWRQDLERHRVFEKTHNELASLSDRELADIGVGRSQIVDIAWDAANRV
jgi:uncharacterized protein YjiS (DUF1127 family)